MVCPSATRAVGVREQMPKEKRTVGRNMVHTRQADRRAGARAGGRQAGWHLQHCLLGPRLQLLQVHAGQPARTSRVQVARLPLGGEAVHHRTEGAHLREPLKSR